MGRKAKNKNRKARAASAGPSADAEPQLRTSESSEIADAAGSSGASSLVGDVGDEDEGPFLVEPPTPDADVHVEDEATTASAGDEMASPIVNELIADAPMQVEKLQVTADEAGTAVGMDEATVETPNASVDPVAVVDAIEDVQTVVVDVKTESATEETADMSVGAEVEASAVASTETKTFTAEAEDAVDAADVADEVTITSDAAVAQQSDEIDPQLVEETEADFNAGVQVESASVATEPTDVVAASVEVSRTIESASEEVAEAEVAVEQQPNETVVSEDVAVDEPTETILSVEERQTETVSTDAFIGEEHHTETFATKDEHIEQHQTETVVTEEIAVEERHTDSVVAEDAAVEELRTENVVKEEEHSEEEHQVEAVATEGEYTVESHTETLLTEETQHQTKTVVTEKVAVEEQHMNTVMTKDAAVQQNHTETFSVVEAAVEEDRIETVVAEEEQIAEHHQVETAASDTLNEQQSMEPVESRFEVTTAMTVEELDVVATDKAASSQSTATVECASVDHDHIDTKHESSERTLEDSVDRKTRAWPMLTTERSFVMEDDDTVKADDTVVVSERMSTDGEDDFEDMTPLPSEGFQAAVIANSMSMMSPVLEKRHLEAIASEQDGKSHRKASSTTAPTASSATRRSSEDHTPNMTPTRVRSRSSSRHSTPDSGFVESAPAPPTVPVPLKRASIMAPTASYAAKHQAEDAPKKTPTRIRSHSSEAKPEISDTGFIKPPPAPPTVPVPPKRASIMAPTASYAAKHQVEDAPKKTPTRVHKLAKPEISDTGFIKPPPAPPTVPVRPKRASIMAPTASSSAKRGHGESAEASIETKTLPQMRRSPGAKPEVSETGFVKPPPPPPTVPIAPKRASIMAPTASSAAKRGGPDVAVDDWARDVPPKPVTRTRATEFVPTVPVAPKRASLLAPTASFKAKSGPEVVVEVLPPPPVETKPLYRNKRYANVQSKVRGIINAPPKKTEPKPAPPAVEEVKQRPALAQKPAMIKSKRYANVQSKIKDIIHSGPNQPDHSAVDRRRSLGAVKRDSAADAARRRSSLAGSSALRNTNASSSGSVSGSDSSDPFAQALAARAHKKKLNNAVPRYLSYENSGVYAQRAQVQQERRRRLEEQNASKSQTRQHQLRVVFAEKLHVNYNAQEAEHSQAALGDVGAKARRAKSRGSRSSSASDEFSASSESKPASVAVAGGVFVLPSALANGISAETVVESVVETSAAVEAAATVEGDAAPQSKIDDGVTKKINFDDTSDDEEEEIAAAAAVPVADVA